MTTSERTTETPDAIAEAQELRNRLAGMRQAAHRYKPLLELLDELPDLADRRLWLMQDVERLRAEGEELTQHVAAQAAEVAASRAKQEAAITAELAGQREQIARNAAALEDQGKRMKANEARITAQEAEIRRLTKGAAALEPART